MHISASAEQGYFVRYHNNTDFANDTYLERIENFLPVYLDEHPMKYHDKFSVNYTFVAEFDTPVEPMESDFTFTLNIAENSLARVYLNDTLILETPYQVCVGDYLHEHTPDARVTSCCTQTYSHTRPMWGDHPFHFRIEYVQRAPAHAGPCLMLAREATRVIDEDTGETEVVLALDSIDNEARAIVQLDNSPFFFNTEITDNFVSGNYTTFHYLPELDVNTGEIVSQDDF